MKQTQVTRSYKDVATKFCQQSGSCIAKIKGLKQIFNWMDTVIYTSHTNNSGQFLPVVRDIFK